jgi:hypothetical protein
MSWRIFDSLEDFVRCGREPIQASNFIEETRMGAMEWQVLETMQISIL